MGGTAGGSGGLLIYHEAAPPNMDAAAYNTVSAEWKAHLESPDVERTEVAYKQNRIAIFQSDLFHATDGTPFRADRFTDHRINLTYLFGRSAD